MNAPRFTTANPGFPRIGLHRELKFALEDYWKGRATEEALLATGAELRRRHWLLQKEHGIDLVPSNDFSLYDQVLDMLVALGATPARFGAGAVTAERYFSMARNSQLQTAMEMTKWFDTNYHYLAPEWSADLPFEVCAAKAVGEFLEARELGIVTRPVLVGPVTLLRLGKSVDGVDPLALLPRMVEAYAALLQALHSAGAEWVQMDEPALVTDLPEEYRTAYRTVYERLAEAPAKLMLTTYFGSLGENLPLTFSLPVAGVHLDLVRGPEQLPKALRAVQPGQVLSLGCVDGRNIWIADLAKAYALVETATRELGAARVQIAPCCSLLHVPHSAATEAALPCSLGRWLSFATEKLDELAAIAAGPEAAVQEFARNAELQRERAAAPSSFDAKVREAMRSLDESMFARAESYPVRVHAQRRELDLPLLPTTTIGSFPQTPEVRKARRQWRSGTLSTVDYEFFLKAATEECIRAQEEIGLDMLVHGEFERNDMVEYFGEQLQGFAFTQNGWVQSYGSRCVKPPLIYGDVARPAPMTVRWSSYAQSLTEKPVKGMLTGPVTILQWSFVRDDLPRREVAWQIALALREEVRDLEAAGLRALQIDEPALREGLPLRVGERAEYLDWAVKAFRLATSVAASATQIHTHMCYCEFEDVLESIAALDADVISIESARSRMELLHAFSHFGYPNEIGPGVYDIHSPRVPAAEEMANLLRLAVKVLKPEQLWVNPDCGLKTRGWPEVMAALRNMCAAAAGLRAELVQPTV
ncbi:MAG: 5-methyltetrahydropteroyltriglutamate--homocysteine S-methyltransferase [Acidobacteria bacterium]|nr:5-methyltetrahydropteroyltriglutamate--homocysteine S-methyltransferase [Acidobacteriota bacterium]MBW4045611.1 5-methyltetrahydropteroyltriglutamate--homocysteine S-methyltransferase [Acidobacteriota bacterium]